MCEDGPTFTGSKKEAGTGQSGVETFAPTILPSLEDTWRLKLFYLLTYLLSANPTEPLPILPDTDN